MTDRSLLDHWLPQPHTLGVLVEMRIAAQELPSRFFWCRRPDAPEMQPSISALRIAELSKSDTPNDVLPKVLQSKYKSEVTKGIPLQR